MAEGQRLNNMIAALEKGQHCFTSFSPPDIGNAVAFSTAPYDGIVFEMEHNPWDSLALRDLLQYMLNRGQIVESGSLTPGVNPMVRVPPNGNEMAQWQAKQALDLGCYGIVFPHISSVQEAYNAVAACRYARPKNKPLYEPAGIRGDGPTQAVRYWGLSQQEYYERADVWPLNPKGELLAVLMIEDTAGMNCLDEMLKNVPGIGTILIGEGDFSQELGYPRQYDHPVVVEAMTQVVATCNENNVAVGHPHVSTANVEWVIEQGYRFLMASPERSYNGLNKGRELTARS